MLTTATGAIAARIDEAIDESIETKSGVERQLIWFRECKTRKSCQDKIEKFVMTRVVIGVTYDDLPNIQHKREIGDLPTENQGLPWGAWDRQGFIIIHKGTRYLRCYRPERGRVVTTKYFKNDKPVEFAEIENCLLASEKNSPSDSDCFNVKIENITAVN